MIKLGNAEESVARGLDWWDSSVTSGNGVAVAIIFRKGIF